MIEIFSDPYNVAVLLVGIGAITAVFVDKKYIPLSVGVLFFTVILKLLFG